jgi:hypothetical protein
MVRSDRAIRRHWTLVAWLTPAYWLARCWAAFANAPPPAALAALPGALNASHGINLYLRI